MRYQLERVYIFGCIKVNIIHYRKEPLSNKILNNDSE